MAKKRPPKTAVAADTSTRPINTAFAGLASLSAMRDRLPSGDSPGANDAVDSAQLQSSAKPPSRVVVRRERKGRKGKTVTRIAGITDDMHGWARRLKRELGCGGALEGNEIVLAGDIGDRVVDWLREAGVETIARGN